MRLEAAMALPMGVVMERTIKKATVPPKKKAPIANAMTHLIVPAILPSTALAYTILSLSKTVKNVRWSAMYRSAAGIKFSSSTFFAASAPSLLNASKYNLR